MKIKSSALKTINSIINSIESSPGYKAFGDDSMEMKVEPSSMWGDYCIYFTHEELQSSFIFFERKEGSRIRHPDTNSEYKTVSSVFDEEAANWVLNILKGL